MKFAINYSPQAEALLREGKIEVDIFKCPAWDELVPRVQREFSAYVHLGLIAGTRTVQTADLDWIEKWLNTTDTLVINTHLAVMEDQFPDDVTISPEAVIERAVRDVEYLGERFGNDRIVVENIPYPDPGWNDGLLREAVDPAVITEIVERTGCGLLLDVAHAIRATEGLGISDVKGYINAMPVHALRELHIVGILPYQDENGVRQDHYPMTDADWIMAEWAIGQVRDGIWATPDTLAFEYGGVGELFESRTQTDVIAEQVPRFYRMVQGVNATFQT